MDKEFWQGVWQRGEIGFHRAAAHPALLRHWPALSRPGASVLVPLCGKTPDMHWLHEQGHAVTGVELSPKAVDEFFKEWGHRPFVSKSAEGLDSYRVENIELLRGDFFTLSPKEGFPLFYDRAALVALPESMRSDYLKHLATCLSEHAEGLLICFEFDEQAMDGPPFPVFENELRETPFFEVQCLSREDVTDTHQGLVARGIETVIESTYRVSKRSQASLTQKTP